MPKYKQASKDTVINKIIERTKLSKDKMGHIELEELAKQVGVSASRISDYINDKSEPSLSTTRRIVSILKLSPEQVLAI